MRNSLYKLEGGGNINIYVAENQVADVKLNREENILVQIMYKIYLDRMERYKDMPSEARREFAKEIGGFNHIDRYMTKRKFSRFGNGLVELIRLHFVDVNDSENIVLTDEFFKYVEADSVS
ncbi:MAG: hypothetical protein FWD71_01290 [Oscillospiraceae bacterium]|nr:hypothetical protein [Oscillospiraceae bacterium]